MDTVPVSFELKVTQAHLDQGLPCRAYQCAVALALNEKFPGTVWSVTGTSARLETSETMAVRYYTSEGLYKLVRDFDRTAYSPQPTTLHFQEQQRE